MTSSDLSSSTSNGQRKRLLTLVIGGFVLAGLAYEGWSLLFAGKRVQTDNAYVAGNLVQITPQTGGTVLAIKADDTDFVQAGQPLVLLDPADSKVALEQAEADLAQKVREARNLYAGRAASAAAVQAREAELARAAADLKRRQAVGDSGAVAPEEVDHARSALQGAEAGLTAAREQLAAATALTEGVAVDRHPSVERAAARVREAFLAFRRAMLPAPVSGYVAKRSVQLGQRIAPGAPLMAIVPLDALWVDANFKESQLARMRIGQPVRITADVYGRDVVFHGKVAGLSAGTGGVFSLLPAQNATGNWIKVVQRVPVRVTLDPKELQVHPLRVGLSLVAEVDVDDDSGLQLAAAPRTTPAYEAPALAAEGDKTLAEANQRVARIIAANLRADVHGKADQGAQ
jgi:membrane fusion protein (multidrug efflux system)